MTSWWARAGGVCVGGGRGWWARGSPLGRWPSSPAPHRPRRAPRALASPRLASLTSAHLPLKIIKIPSPPPAADGDHPVHGARAGRQQGGLRGAHPHLSRLGARRAGAPGAARRAGRARRVPGPRRPPALRPGHGLRPAAALGRRVGRGGRAGGRRALGGRHVAPAPRRRRRAAAVGGAGGGGGQPGAGAGGGVAVRGQARRGQGDGVAVQRQPGGQRQAAGGVCGGALQIPAA
jgi:hypothetical protein